MKMLTRKLQEEYGLVNVETPRGQSRMSISLDPVNLELELEAVAKLIENMDAQLKSCNQKFFGHQLSIVDIIYYWEISTL